MSKEKQREERLAKQDRSRETCEALIVFTDFRLFFQIPYENSDHPDTRRANTGPEAIPMS